MKSKSITTNQFFELYPDIPVRTFWSWVYRGKKVQLNGLHQWSEPYFLPVKRKKKFRPFKIPLKGLAKFFKQTRQNEYYYRVPSYAKNKYIVSSQPNYLNVLNIPKTNKSVRLQPSYEKESK